MNLFFLSKNRVKTVNIVLDVGSKSVGGGIYEINQNDFTRLLYATRETISFNQVLTGEKLLIAMSRSLDLVLGHLKKYGLAHLEKSEQVKYQLNKIVIILSSPWHIGETKTLRVSEPKSFIVSQSIINNLIEKEDKDFSEGFNEEKRKESDLKILEHKTIEIRLNGYPTASPFGKLAKFVELKIFSSFFSNHFFEKITSVISKHFPENKIDFHTFLLSAFASIRDVFNDKSDFIVIQVGGEVTEIAVVKKNVIVEVISFPLGHNELLRSLSKICKNHPDCALEALVKLHFESKIINSDKKKVDNSISETMISWTELLNGILTDISKNVFLPQDIFLFEDTIYAPIFEEFVKSVDLSKIALSAGTFKIMTGPKLESSFVKPGNPLSVDGTLSMLVNFANKHSL